MKIVSLNTWGGRLFGDLLLELPRLQPDVACLSEVFSAPEVPEKLFAQFPNGDRFLPNILRSLKAALPGYTDHFYPFSTDTVTSGYQSDFPLHKGIATFVKKELVTLSSNTGFVYGQYSPRFSAQMPSSRNVHAVRVLQEDGTTITIAHLHGVHTGKNKEDTPARHEQAERLLTFLKGVTRPHEKIVVCGDLNVLPDSSLLSALKAYGLRDLIAEYGIDDTRTSFYERPGPRFADYMLVSPAVEVDTFSVPLLPEISDHRPLILECY